MESVKFIIQELSKEPFKKKFNMVSFSSLDSRQLLQLLNDALAEIDDRHRMDIRNEPVDQTASRIIEALRIFRYSLPQDEASLQAFRQALSSGDRSVIYPVLEWLLTPERTAELKKRSYLARYLVRLTVPAEFLQVDEIAQLFEQYEHHIEDFKRAHRENDELKQQLGANLSPADIRREIQAMEEEREQLQKRVERQKQKVNSISGNRAILDSAKQLRVEREREQKNTKQIQEIRLEMMHADHAVQRLQKQVDELKESATGATFESVMQRLEEEVKVNEYLANDQLPKELAALNKQIAYLNKIARETLGPSDVDQIRQKVRQSTAEVNKLNEQRMQHIQAASSAGGEDAEKLNVYRQQAALIARKKDAAVEQLRTMREEITTLETELTEKQRAAAERGGSGAAGAGSGDGAMRFEEFKRYVQSVKSKHQAFKARKSELGALQTEVGTLSRTREILQRKADALQKEVESLEASGGVIGYHTAAAELEKVSEAKSAVDTQKASTLEEMSDIVHKFQKRVDQKKAQLAPLLQELKPLRQRVLDLEAEHREKKAAFESLVAGYEQNRAQLEKEVKALREERVAEESRFHYLNASRKALELQMQRVQEELRGYADRGGQKRPSYREQYNKRIQELEQQSKALRDKQKSLHDATDAHRRQMRLWRDVEALLIAKLAAAGISGVASSDQLQSTAKPTAPAASSSPSRGGKRGADRLVIE